MFATELFKTAWYIEKHCNAYVWNKGLANGVLNNIEIKIKNTIKKKDTYSHISYT